LSLHNRNAIIYGAGSSMGSAIARALAKAGANVLVTGRTLGPVATSVNEIAAADGKAKAVTVDALDARRWVPQMLGLRRYLAHPSRTWIRRPAVLPRRWP
jgi:NAD(P)-dependent dehydrogenase (short-subunit alcohol dehydrogenase family)